MKKIILIVYAAFGFISLNNAMTIDSQIIECLRTKNNKDLKKILSKEICYHKDSNGKTVFRRIFSDKNIDGEIKLRLLATINLCDKVKERYKKPRILSVDIISPLLLKNNFKSQLFSQLYKIYPDTISTIIFEVLVYFMMLDHKSITQEDGNIAVIATLKEFQKTVPKFVLSKEQQSNCFIFLLEKALIISNLREYVHAKNFIISEYVEKLDKDLDQSIKSNVSTICILIKKLLDDYGVDSAIIVRMFCENSTREEFEISIGSIPYSNIMVNHFKNKEYGFIHNFIASKNIIYCDTTGTNIMVDFIKTNALSQKDKKNLLNLIFEGASQAISNNLLNFYQQGKDEKTGDVPLSAAIKMGLWDLACYLIDCGASFEYLLYYNEYQRYYSCCVDLLKSDRKIPFFIEAGEMVDIVLAEIIGDSQLSQEGKIAILVRLFGSADLSKCNFDIYSYEELLILMKAAQKYDIDLNYFEAIKKEFQKKQQKNRINNYLQEKLNHNEKNDSVEKNNNSVFLIHNNNDVIFNFLNESNEVKSQEVFKIKKEVSSQHLQNKKLNSWMKSVETAYSLWSTASEFFITEDDFITFLGLLEACKNPTTKNTNKEKAKHKLIHYLFTTLPFNHNDVAAKVKNKRENLPMSYNILLSLRNKPKNNF